VVSLKQSINEEATATLNVRISLKSFKAPAMPKRLHLRVRLGSPGSTLLQADFKFIVVEVHAVLKQNAFISAAVISTVEISNLL
jgi:hypothetical protein